MYVKKIGTINGEKPYERTCSKCKSELIYTKDDEKCNCGIDGDTLYIVCPICANHITTNWRSHR